MFRNRGLLAVAMMIWGAGAALAASPAVSSLDRESFERERQAVVAQISEGDTYRELSADDKAVVLAGLDRISAALANGDDHADLRADLERVNALLARAAADSRIICERQRAMGSNRVERVCKTHARWQAERGFR